jgi:hypothetical protein
MLGFVYRREVNCFAPTSSFLPPYAERPSPRNSYPIDTRHGLFLFFDVLCCRLRFFFKKGAAEASHGAVQVLILERSLLCGTADCDHLCPCGPFLWSLWEQKVEFQSLYIRLVPSATICFG